MANNIALKQCHSRYYLLLNPDTEVYLNSLQVLVDTAKEYQEAWGIGPAIVNRDGSPQRTGVRFPKNWNIFVETFFLDRIFPHSRIFGKHKELYRDQSIKREIDYVQGSCLLISDDAIKKIGILDEEYFMYFEETDWCYRVHKAGKRILYSPTSIIKHYGGGEFAHYDEHKIINYHKSLLLFYRKHYSYSKILVVRYILIIRSMIRLCVWSLMVVFYPSIKGRLVSIRIGYFSVLNMLFRWVP